MLSTLVALLCRIIFILATAVAACGLSVLTLRSPFLAMLVLLAIAWRRFRRPRHSHSHGSARATTPIDLERADLLGASGPILARAMPDAPSKGAALRSLVSPQVASEPACRMFLAAYLGPQWYADRFIRLNNHVHLLTCAPSGAGKSVSVLIPNLLSHRGSCVVIDPKGELFKLTADHRRRKFGHKVIRIDPFGVCGPGGDTLNPFDFIDATKDAFLDQCRDLAHMLVIRKGTDEKDPHWNDSAELTLTAFTAFVCGCEPNPLERNLQTVRAIASARKSYTNAVEIMQQTAACSGVIQRLGGLLTWFTGDEQSSVLTTFQRHTAFLDSPVIARNTATSSFDPRILRTGRATIYLCLPADRLSSLACLQRMWVGTIMRRITRGVTDERAPVLWLLDEAGNLGHLAAVEEAATLMRGMGIRLWFFFQSLDQLKSCFCEKAATVLDNIGTQQFFGINSLTTAKEISERIGEATIANTSTNRSTSKSHPVGGHGRDGPPPGSYSTSRTETSADIARRLLKPEEVLVLPEDLTLIFHKNMPVIFARLLRYYSAPEFKRGRSGTQPGLGLDAAVTAVLALAASVFFAVFMAAMPAPRLGPRPAVVGPYAVPNGYRPLSPAHRFSPGQMRIYRANPGMAPSRPAYRRQTLHGVPGTGFFPNGVR